MSEGWDPCPMDALCENCGHPMAGHFREDTRCHRCPCKHWRCQHGGAHFQLTEQEAGR